MWQPLTEPVVEDVHSVLVEVDVAFGNVVGRSVADVGALLATGSCWGVHDAEGSLCGVVGSVPDEECVLGLVASRPGRADLLAEAVPLLEEALAAGAPLWLPTRDRDAGAMAAAHGLVSAYTDLQMRTPTTVASASPPPSGARLRESNPLPRASGMSTTWGELVAACIGSVEEREDGRFGAVRHRDVAPTARCRGLGRWVLNELLVRFARAGLIEAQLGVHADNVSGAPDLYRSLGWSVVSSQDKWVRPPSYPRARLSCASRRDGPYQVSSRPLTSSVGVSVKASGPS